jgi:hypothetical protein
MDTEDIKAYRTMTPGQRLERGLRFIGQAWHFKAAAVRVHHPGWSEEKVKSEVHRRVQDGMKPEQLYEL